MTKHADERDMAWHHAPDIQVVLDAQGVLIAVNPAWTRVLGHVVSDVVGHSFREFVWDDDTEKTADAVALVASGVDVAQFENRYRRKDGSPCVLSWQASSEAGMLFGYARDVTAEQAQAAELDQRVIERERLWRTNPMLFAVAAYDSTIIEVNPAWTTLLGWTPAELVGRSYAEYLHPDDAQRSLDWARRLASGSDVEQLENRYRCKGGGHRWIAWSITANDDRFHCVGRDVTNHKAKANEVHALEANLRQSQKVEAVGQLTGGVAHDFNNLLTVIRGSVDLLRLPNLSEERRKRYIDAIADTADRATRLTSQLLAFARRSALQPEVFDAGHRVRALEEMIGTLAGSRITVDLDLADDPCLVTADPSQFDTAIVNMAVNARDAMDREGNITIQIRPSPFVPLIRSHPRIDGDFVAVSITDTGTGIDPDRIEHIFEPFYTSKGVGEGTGLGLSQVFGFAKQSGGEIQVDTAPGSGSTFTLYLPRAIAMAPNVVVVPHAPPIKAGACILVVEDNVGVGAFAVQALVELGYVTMLAINAIDALNILEKHSDEIDAVFSDVVMPGMSGIELAKEIHGTYPDLPIVLTSGFSDVLARQGTHGFALLHKPYSIKELASALGAAAKRIHGPA